MVMLYKKERIFITYILTHKRLEIKGFFETDKKCEDIMFIGKGEDVNFISLNLPHSLPRIPWL